MLKLVLKDYRCRFLLEWKVYWTKILWYFWWSYVYAMLMLRLDVTRYTVGMLPMLLGFWLSRMYPNALSKMLFLCPMSKKDRVNYLWTAYVLRVGIAAGVYFAVSLPAAAAGHIAGIQYGWLTLGVVSFIVGANMHHPFLSLTIARKEGEKDFWIALVYGVLCLFSQLFGWGVMISFASAGKLGLEARTDQSILVGLVILELLINAGICVICYKPVIRSSMNYESCWMAGKGC